jgi:arginase
VTQGSFPLVLSGNCNSALGTVSGIDPSRLGVIWFDAHSDFNTPETTISGFLDGMGLATITGHCWTKLVTTIPGFVPIPEKHVLQIGVRQMDQEEQERLKQSQILLVRGEQVRQVGIRESIAGALHALRSRVERVYVHIDLDVFDPQRVGRANSYAEPNGLSVDEMEEALSMIAHQFLIAAAGFASYDPGCDQESKLFHAGVRLMEHLIQAIQQEGQTGRNL